MLCWRSPGDGCSGGPRGISCSSAFSTICLTIGLRFSSSSALLLKNWLRSFSCSMAFSTHSGVSTPLKTPHSTPASTANPWMAAQPTLNFAPPRYWQAHALGDSRNLLIWLTETPGQPVLLKTVFCRLFCLFVCHITLHLSHA